MNLQKGTVYVLNGKNSENPDYLILLENKDDSLNLILSKSKFHSPLGADGHTVKYENVSVRVEKSNFREILNDLGKM